MLTEKEVLERAFQALDELVGQVALPATMPTEVKAPENAPSTSGPHAAMPPLKCHAIELWCDHAGGRVFIVADEEDAQEAIRRFGARRGEAWIPGEIELVARLKDQDIRDEVAEFKRKLDCSLPPEATCEGTSWEEWKAAALNRLFLEQGKTGRLGRITAETVRHGERRRLGGRETQDRR